VKSENCFFAFPVTIGGHMEWFVWNCCARFDHWYPLGLC
jgi:hypothetical protein